MTTVDVKNICKEHRDTPSELKEKKTYFRNCENLCLMVRKTELSLFRWSKKSEYRLHIQCSVHINFCVKCTCFSPEN